MKRHRNRWTIFPFWEKKMFFVTLLLSVWRTDRTKEELKNNTNLRGEMSRCLCARTVYRNRSVAAHCGAMAKMPWTSGKTKCWPLWDMADVKGLTFWCAGLRSVHINQYQELGHLLFSSWNYIASTVLLAIQRKRRSTWQWTCSTVPRSTGRESSSVETKEKVPR